MRRKKIKFSPKLQSSSLDDIKRFVPKDALNTPVISSYNNLPTSYQKGGVTNPQSDYNLKRAKELGYTRDETGHMPSVDHETGMWLKSKKHPTAYKEYISMMLNPDVKAVVNPEGYFGENQLQYVPRHQNGRLPKYQMAGIVPDNFLQKGIDEGIRDLKNEESLKALYAQNPSMQTYKPKDPGSIDYGPTHVNSGNNPNMQWTNGVATAPWAKQYKQDAFNTEVVLGAAGAAAEGAIIRGAKAYSAGKKAYSAGKKVNSKVSKEQSYLDYIPEERQTNDFLAEVKGELKQGAENRLDIKEGNEWLQNWINHPATQKKVLDSRAKTMNKLTESLDDPKNAGILSADKNRLVKKVDEEYTEAANYIANSKEYPLTSQFKDLFNPAEIGIHQGNSGVSYKHMMGKSSSVLEPWDEGYKHLPRFNQSWISRKYAPRYKYGYTVDSPKTLTTVHEGTHDWVNNYLINKSGQADLIHKNLTPQSLRNTKAWKKARDMGKDPSDVMTDTDSYNGYLADPTEVHARIMEMRKFFKISPDTYVTPEKVGKMLKEYDPDGFSIAFGHNSEKKNVKMAKLFNNLFSGATGVTVANQLLNNQQEKPSYQNGGLPKYQNGTPPVKKKLDLESVKDSRGNINDWALTELLANTAGSFNHHLENIPGQEFVLPDSTYYNRLIDDIDQYNKIKDEAFVDSTNANNAYNNLWGILGEQQDNMVNKHDQKASKYTPFNNTPTVPNDVLADWVGRKADAWMNLRNSVKNSDHFSIRTKDQQYKGQRANVHSDLPFLANYDNSVVENINNTVGLSSLGSIGKLKEGDAYFDNHTTTRLPLMDLPKPKKPTYHTLTVEQPVKSEQAVESVEQPLYPQTPIKTTVATPTGNYDNPDVKPVTEIKMPDGMWTKEKFINRYGEKVWNEQHPPKKLGNGGVLENKQSQDKTIDSFYPRKQALAMGSEMSYPYRTLQNPSYGDIRINTPKYQDGIIHPIHIEKRYGPSNIPNDSSMMYQTGGAVVTDYDKNWDYKKEDGVVYAKRKDAEKWMSPKVGSAAELAIQKNVFGSPSELEEAVQMPIPESPNLNVTPPQAIGDTIQSVAPLPIDMAPTAPTERMLPEMSMPDISMPDVSMPDIDMPDLSLSEKLLQAQGMLGSLWEGAKDVGGDIMDDVASAGSTVSSFLQDKVEDINEEVTDAIKFKKEAEETVAAKSQQISNYLSDIFTPDSEEAEPISPEQVPAEKSRTEAFAEMLRGVQVPDMPDVALPKMQMPDVSIPDLPDLPDVSIPDLEVPKVSLPDMPDISMPDMPDVGAFTGYAKEVISDAVESGQSSLSDLKNFFKGELIDYAEDFKETGENIKEGINSAIDAAKDLPDLLSSIADVEEEVKKERGDSGAPGPPPEVEPDLVLSPEDAAPKETFEEMLVRGANSLHTGHILAGDVMYRVENGEITKKMETIVGKTTTARKGARSELSYAATLPKFWYNDDGSLREFETPEGLKTGPEIKKENLFNKYSGTTPAGIYEFTNQPVKAYENRGYSSYLKGVGETPDPTTRTYFTNERGERKYVDSSTAYHPYPGEKAKAIRDKALKDLNISNELSASCLQNMDCDNRDMGILLESNPSFRDSLVVIVPSMGELSRAAVEGFAKRFDNAETKEEQGKVLQRLQALATLD